MLAPLLAAIVLLAAAAPSHALWPEPRNLQAGTTAVKLSPLFNIKVSVTRAPNDLHDAVTRTTQFLRSDKLERLVVGRGSVDAGVVAHAKTLSSLTLQLIPGAVARAITTEAQVALEDRDEAYSLSVPASGAATLIANTTLGLLRGLTTFEQLWYYHSGTVYAINAPVHIEDSPAYPYRGFMLDTARNFFPVSDITRTLDAMSWVKINTFHWHVVDSQSFPLEVPGYLDLAQKGAYSASSVYSPKDVADIVSYAGARGIDVLIEVDTPGHTSVISKAHPEHVACAEATPWTNFANEPPAGQLRLASGATANYTAGLLTATAKIFPSKLFSTGGDELNVNCYTADAETQQSLSASGKTLEQALDTFTQTSHAALEALGKTPVVWEEMVLVHNVTLSNSTIVLVWISSQDAVDVAAKGFKIIHSPSDYFYLDCGGGGWVGNNPAGNSWCEPFKTWQKGCLSADQAKLVLGGQQLLWTEQSGPENLDSIVWPRAAASAEVFWSGPGDVDAALPRLHDVAYRFKQRGVQAIALQPEWCALRPGACDS